MNEEKGKGMGAQYLEWAGKRLWFLQCHYLEDTLTRKDLAILRRSLAKPCGSDPKAARWSLDGMPGRRADGPRPYTSMERASWTAFGLYAVHQQGDQDHGMHRRGIRLEQALTDLELDDPTARDRNARLYAARDMGEAIAPLSRIMRELNARRISLDHATLALDLRDLDRPRSRDRIIGRWTRRPRPE